MSELVIDDTGWAPAIMTVVLTNHQTVTIGPDPKDVLEADKAEWDAHPPEGYVSSTVELVEPEEEPE